MRLRMVHLYPDLLNLYGDRGNVIVLRRRAEWLGFTLEVVRVGLGAEVDLADYDFIFIGGGQDREQEILATDLREKKAPALKRAIEADRVVLAVCGGYQMLGHYYRTLEGEEIPGLGLLDLYTEAGRGRLVGNVAVAVDFLAEPTLVGFENHSGRTVLGPGVEPLGRVLAGYGNNGHDGFEGARYRQVYGTYLHGSLLPKNPHLADHLLLTGLRNRYGPEVSLPRLADRTERLAHAAILHRLGVEGRETRAGSRTGRRRQPPPRPRETPPPAGG